MRSRPLPRGLLGGAGGAIGILPLLPIASGLAIRYASPPTLPGALRTFADVKEATWAEAAVFLLAVPLAAFFFGSVIPKALARIAPTGSLSFEWSGAAFAASFFLAQRGARPKLALLAGILFAALVAFGIVAFRRSFRLRRLFTRESRGALGSLALAGACVDLARRGGPGAPAVIPDLATELVIAAILLTALAAVVDLLFAPRPGSLLRRLGAAAFVPVSLSAIVLLTTRRSGILAAAALLALPAAAALARRRRPARPLLPAAFLLLIFACAWRVRREPVVTVEMFEDGCSLAFAQAYGHGARPYAETYPLHGWGSDGGVDGLAFRLFGPTLRVYRVRTTIWSALSPPLLAAASAAALGTGSWGVLGSLVSGSFAPRLIERQALAFGAMALLYLHLRRGSRAALVGAGVLTGWEMLYGLDFGLTLLAGGSAGLLLLPTLEARLARIRLGLRPLALFLAGALLGAAPFLAILAARGVFSDFVRVTFLEIPRWVMPAWGIPAGSFWKAILPARDVPTVAVLLAGQGMQFFFVMALLAAAGAALLLRSASATLEPEDRAAWIGFCVAAFAMRGVLGRADDVHLWNYAVFAGVPAAWLLRCAWRSRARGALFALLAVAMLVRLHPFHRVEETLQAAVAAASPGARSGGEKPPRSGGERIPAGQAGELTAFREAIDARLAPGETFFDFANQPALYFFADRVPPVRFHTVAQYESPEKQREVIEALEAKKPPVAVLTDTFYSNLDVANGERAPEVLRYLADHYEWDVRVGPWRLARRKSSSTGDAPARP